jgi:hypothetical protein
MGWQGFSKGIFLSPLCHLMKTLAFTPANLMEAYLTMIEHQQQSPTGTQYFYNIQTSQSKISGH